MVSKIIAFFEKYTPGIPFLLWSLGGISVTAFFVIFKNNISIPFDQISFILILGMIWFLLSEVSKSKFEEMLGKRFIFSLDSLFYLVFFGSIVYLTGYFKGDLFFIFILMFIAAPLFAKKVIDLIILTITVAVLNYVIYFNTTHVHDSYEVGIITLYLIFYFIVAMTMRYYLVRNGGKNSKPSEYSELDLDEDKISGKTWEQIKEESGKKTDIAAEEIIGSDIQLERIERELKRKIVQLEKFNKVMIGRELKMVELKKKIELLENQLKDENDKS